MLAIETLLQSVDARLQNVDTWLNTMAVAVASLDVKVDRLPTWKGIAATAASTLVAAGGLQAWLANGGAQLLARMFAA